MTIYKLRLSAHACKGFHTNKHHFVFSSLAPKAPVKYCRSDDVSPHGLTFYTLGPLSKITCLSSSKVSTKQRFSLLKSHGDYVS